MSDTIPKPIMTKAQADKIIAEANPQKLYKDKEAEILETKFQNLANDRATREPLPGPTSEAFTEDEIVVNTPSGGTVSIRKMKAIDITIFKLIDSPFYKLIMNDIQPDPKDTNPMKALFPDEELLYQVVYQFTHPAKDVYKLIKQGKNKFDEVVIEDIGVTYSPADLLVVVEAVLGHIGMVNSAKVALEAPPTEDDKKKLISS